MLTDFLKNFSELKSNHQVLFGFLVFLATTIFSWSIQKVIEDCIINVKYKKYFYFVIILFSLAILLIANHFVKELA